MTIKIRETHILCRRADGDYFGEHPGVPDLPATEAVKRLVESHMDLLAKVRLNNALAMDAKRPDMIVSVGRHAAPRA